MITVPLEKIGMAQYNDENVIKAWKWVMSFISEADWQHRKDTIEQKIKFEIKDEERSPGFISEGTLLAEKNDVISWYLYLVEKLIYEPYKYEYFQGARIVPIFYRIGSDLELLQKIEGIEDRMKIMLKKRRSETDALLFEILVALLWARNGYEVKFIPEQTGVKTPDMIVRKEKKEWHVECKRQSKTSDYAYRETAKRQKMASYIGDILMSENILLDIVFHVELETLPDTFLYDLLKNKIQLAIPGVVVSNAEVTIRLAYVNMGAIRSHLADHSVKYNSPMMSYLIAGQPIDNLAFTVGIKANLFRVGEGDVNNNYISEVGNAFGIVCRCDAKEAVFAKARDIKTQIKSAIEQFKPDVPSVLHVGLETYDGPEVEAERFEKIQNTIHRINPADSSLRWIFCHFFQSYAPHDQNWVFDESVTTISPYVNPKPPISTVHLIIPDEIELIAKAHWERPLY